MDKERPKRKYFSLAEAEAKVGQQVRSRVEFSDVPQGTTGLVVFADLTGWTKLATDEGKEYLHIQIGKPLVDCFTKDECGRFLEEVSAEESNPEDEAFSRQSL